jgi:nicotinate (nicotinamide) nucleotide adenylyltransferase
MATAESFTLVFGLTADPPHRGHEQVIRNSFSWAQAQSLSIDRFVLVPTYQPNLIADKQQPRTPFKHRMQMCQLLARELAMALNSSIEVSDIERLLHQASGQKSYSFETLKHIQAEHRLFVLSADHFGGRWPKFRKWHQWQQLVKDNGLLIHQRPGHTINHSFIRQLRDLNPHVYVVTGLPSVEVSSTHLRHILFQRKEPHDALLNPIIFNYLKKHHLYQ